MNLRVITRFLCFVISLIKTRKFPILYLKNTYGDDSINVFYECRSAFRRLEKAKLDLEFLQICKIYGLTPKFLRFRLYRRSLQSSAIYTSMQDTLLDNEICCKRTAISTFEIKAEHLRKSIHLKYNVLDSVYALHCINNFNQEYLSSVKDTHAKKLEKLGGCPTLNPCDPTKVIFNFSSVVLTPRLKTLLAFGLDFCLPIYKLNFIQYFLCFERILSLLKPDMFFNSDSNVSTAFFNQFKLLVSNGFYNFNARKILSPIIKSGDFKLLKDLSKNSNIIVTKPDKGRGVVLIDRNNYNDSMLKILSDRTKFTLIPDSLYNSLRVEDKVNNFLNLKT